MIDDGTLSLARQWAWWLQDRVKWVRVRVSAEEGEGRLAGLECAGLRRNVFFFQFGFFLLTFLENYMFR